MTKSFIYEYYQPYSNFNITENFENKKKHKNLEYKKVNNMCFPPNKQCDLSGRIPICQNIVHNKIGGITITINEALNKRLLENPYVD